MHYYEIKYIVRYRYYPDINETTHLEIDTEPVFKLMQTTLSGVDGRRYDDKSKKVLIIQPNRWKNIALIPVHESKLQELIGGGAELVEPSSLYNDVIDAKIQVAFICSKYLIEPERVYTVTGGLLTSSAYKELVKLFYEDFPEKYI